MDHTEDANREETASTSERITGVGGPEGDDGIETEAGSTLRSCFVVLICVPLLACVGIGALIFLYRLVAPHLVGLTKGKSGDALFLLLFLSLTSYLFSKGFRIAYGFSWMKSAVGTLALYLLAAAIFGIGATLNRSGHGNLASAFSAIFGGTWGLFVLTRLMPHALTDPPRGKEMKDRNEPKA